MIPAGPIARAVITATHVDRGDSWWLLLRDSDLHETHLHNSMLGIPDLNEWTAARVHRFRREAGITPRQIAFDNSKVDLEDLP